jgi:protein-S-isoprenylcysteine O-methyltransferase Ste14
MAPLFSLPEAVIFWVTLFAVYAGLGVVTHGPASVQWDETTATRKRKEEFSPYLLVAASVAAVVIGYVRIGVLPHWLFYPGEILFVLGYVFTGYSIRLLGRYYSTYVEVLPDHRVVQSGPYRLVRHPNYVGQVVGAIGLGLALQSWIALLVLMIAAAGYFAYRIRNEEAFLLTELGDDYAKYMTRTKRLIPFVF